jgi:hypothetical protein
MATRGWESVKAIVSPAKPPRARVQRPVVTRSKFGAVRTVIHGWTFHSKVEGARYLALLALGESGYIRNLELQPRFPLTVNGWTIGTYIADFRYEQRIDALHYRAPSFDRVSVELVDDWRDVIEDVKGWRTLPFSRWKMKHFTAQYGLTVQEIR